MLGLQFRNRLVGESGITSAEEIRLELVRDFTSLFGVGWGGVDTAGDFP